MAIRVAHYMNGVKNRRIPIVMIAVLWSRGVDVKTSDYVHLPCCGSIGTYAATRPLKDAHKVFIHRRYEYLPFIIEIVKINMIRKIVIKDVASFDNHEKVNLIHSGNACGKTTFSRVLS